MYSEINNSSTNSVQTLYVEKNNVAVPVPTQVTNTRTQTIRTKVPHNLTF